MQGLFLAMILRSGAATLSGLLLLIVLVLLLIGSPLLIIGASRLEDWRILRNWRLRNTDEQKNVPAF
jgi:hypothetical protein